MFRILLSHPLCEEGMRKLYTFDDISVTVANEDTPEGILPYLVDADAFILRVGSVSGDMLRMCNKLKVIARPGVGVDTIAVSEATAMGIPVVITPGENSRSVAEHVFALLLSVSKNLFESRKEALLGNYSVRNKYRSFELYGKTIGIVGFGHIGKLVAKIAQGFGMQVYAYDPFVKKSVIEEQGVIPVSSLVDILEKCKVVTLHVASTEETRGMIRKETLCLMQDDSILINCARGDLVNEEDLYVALKEGKLMAAAEDMMAKEPFDLSSPLLTLDNFIATPHMAALTGESAARCAIKAVEGVMAVLHKNEWPYVYDKKVYQSSSWLERKEEKSDADADR